MRIYTKRLIKADQVITPSDFNQENQALSEVINGSIGQHNIPATSISPSHLEDRTYELAGDVSISRGVWSDYYTTWGSGGNATTTIYSKALRTASLPAGWISLSDEGISEALIEFTDLQQGILEGYMIVDFERRAGYVDVGGGSYAREGTSVWTNWGIFYDGQLIKETGSIYPRRYTVTLPWSIPTNGGTHTIDIRFKYSTEKLASASDQYDQTMDVFQVAHVITNLKR